MSVKYKNLPRRKGKVCVFPEIKYGKNLGVVIIGNPDGLLYLADLLKYVAQLDQQKNGVPQGERAHIHLTPGTQIGWHSSSVEICRADAQGTKETPKYFEE